MRRDGEPSLVAGRPDARVLLGNRLEQRQMNRHLCTPAGTVASGCHSPSVHVHEPAHERQADAKTSRRPIEAAIGVREQIEHLRQRLRRDARTIVRNAEHGLVTLAFGAELDAATLGRELRGIVQDIRDDLRQTREITHDLEVVVDRRNRQRVPTLRDERLAGLEGVEHDGAELQTLPLKLDQAASDPRHVHEIVHEAAEVRDLAADDAGRLFDRGTWGVGAAYELGGRANGRQWIAKLVRQDRQELVLPPVGLFELQRAFGDAALELLVQLLQLVRLAVKLDESRDLRAQDLRHDRHREIVHRAALVPAQPVELSERDP